MAKRATRRMKTHKKSRGGCGNCKIRKVKVWLANSSPQNVPQLKSTSSAMTASQCASDARCTAPSAIMTLSTRTYSHWSIGRVAFSFCNRQCLLKICQSSEASIPKQVLSKASPRLFSQEDIISQLGTWSYSTTLKQGLSSR